MVRAFAIGCVVMLAAACGKDDNGQGGEVIDAASGGGSDAGRRDSGAADANNSSGGTQGVGQFCDTLPEGGPSCMDGLECCADKICQVTGECGGGNPGFIPCECTDDCNNSFICCEGGGQTFCTKRNGCAQVGGTEIDVCP